jgi:DNA-binding response OmpR family regulator
MPAMSFRRDLRTHPLIWSSASILNFIESPFPNQVQDTLRLEMVACRKTVHQGRLQLRVLIIEDEPRLAENIARSLRESAGYAVDIAHDGQEGLFLAESSEYDIVLLDLMLPQMDGMQLLGRIRQAGQRTPVLVVTARDDKESVVALLNAGADDYLTKPFDLGELLARTKALIRRGKGQPSPVLSVGDLELNTVNRSVRRGGRPITLTAMEYRVLEYLAHRPRAVVSKTELLEHLYDYNWEKFSNVIEVYISGLRRKLDDGSSRQLIHTLRGQGYVLQDGTAPG